MKDPKLSDKEVMELVSKFEKMSDEQKKAKLLGEGGYKKVYDIHPDYVLKESTIANSKRATSDLAKDYLSLKQLKKEGIPTETAMLVNRPGERPLQLQKKLDMNGKKKEISKAVDNFNKLEWEKGITGTDMGAANFGFDKDRAAKMLDTYTFSSKDMKKNNALRTARDAIVDRLTSAKAAKVYRQFAGAIPFAGAAYGLMSGNPAEAAEQAAGDIPVAGQAYEALKSEDLGSSMDDREMIAERNALINYKNSPAGQNARNKQGENMGRNPASIEDPTQGNREAIGNFLKKLVPSGSPLAQSGESALTPEALAQMEAQKQAPAIPSAAPAIPAAPTQEEFVTQEATQPTQQQAPQSDYKALGDQYAKGLQMEASAQDKLGKQESEVLNAQAKMINDQAIQAQELQKQRDIDLAEIESDRKKAQDDLDSKKIEPHGYFHNKSMFQKIVGGIGMFLGSITPEGARNVASIVEKEIERDTESQKLDYQLRKGKVDAVANRYKTYMDKYKDDALAKMAMNKEKLLAADYQLKGLQMASKGDIARAKAESGRAEIGMKISELDQKMFTAMQKNKEKNVSIPGYSGVITDPVSAREFRSMVADSPSVMNDVNSLLDINNKFLGGALDSKARATAESAALRLQGGLRVAMLGPGTVNDSERQLLVDAISNPTNLFSLKGSNKIRLESLKKAYQNKIESNARALGLTKNLPSGAKEI